MKCIVLTAIFSILFLYTFYSQKPEVETTGSGLVEEADFLVNQTMFDDLINHVNDYFLGKIEKEQLSLYFFNEDELKKFLLISKNIENVEEILIKELIGFNQELQEFFSAKHNIAQSASLMNLRKKYGESDQIKALIPKIQLIKNDGSTELLSFIVVEYDSAYKIIKMEH